MSANMNDQTMRIRGDADCCHGNAFVGVNTFGEECYVIKVDRRQLDDWVMMKESLVDIESTYGGLSDEKVS